MESETIENKMRTFMCRLNFIQMTHLVQLVVYFVEDQGLVIVSSESFHHIVNYSARIRQWNMRSKVILSSLTLSGIKNVDNLNSVKIDHHTSARTAGNILYFICLKGGL